MISPVNLIHFNRINSKHSNTINFQGIKNANTPSLFVFDLDGTLASANSDQMDLIYKYAQNKNAKVVYATGRVKPEVESLQNKLSKKGITLKNPDYLIANNGQFLYENVGGFMVGNKDYQELLREKTGFDRETVYDTMKEISEKYTYNDDELNSLENLEEVRSSDPNYYNSKISYYEWNASDNMVEYFISSDVDIEKLKEEISLKLLQKGVKTKFIQNRYPKPIMDACSKSILLQSNSLRRHKDGAMSALFLCPCNKADGVDFVRSIEQVPFCEVLIAGNDDNDISMANLSSKGANFICLNDSSNELIEHCRTLNENVFLALKKGAGAIIEGINFFSSRS